MLLYSTQRGGVHAWDLRTKEVRGEGGGRKGCLCQCVTYIPPLNANVPITPYSPPSVHLSFALIPASFLLSSPSPSPSSPPPSPPPSPGRVVPALTRI